MIKEGLILYVGKKSVTVITKDNEYYKLPRKQSMYMTQEIEFKESDIINVSYIAKRILAVAACLVLVWGTVFYFNNYQNIGISKEFVCISLDINPSLEFNVDINQNVFEVDGLNSDATKLLEGLNLEGMKIDDAFSKVIEKYVEEDRIDSADKIYFLISGTVNPINKDVSENIDKAENKLSDILKRLEIDINDHVGLNYEALMVGAKTEEREQAEENGISLGRYALYSELNALGIKITIEEIKSTSIEDLVKKYLEVKNLTALAEVTPASAVINNQTPTQTPLTPAVVLTQAPMTSNTNPTANINKETEPTPQPTPTVVKTKEPVILPSASPTSVVIVAPETTTTTDATPTPKEVGLGLIGEYYDDMDLTDLKAVSLDPLINFYWGAGEAISAMNDDEIYSMRWTGHIQPAYSEEYTFYITRDNGARLWIDNKLIIDQWDSSWNVITKATISLKSGQKYDIKIEYFNNTGSGIIQLKWKSKSLEMCVVPTECLYPK